MCDRRNVAQQSYANAQCFQIKRTCSDTLDPRRPVFGVQRSQTRCPLIIETLTGNTDNDGNLVGELVKGKNKLCLDCGESLCWRGDNGVSVDVSEGCITFGLE